MSYIFFVSSVIKQFEDRPKKRGENMLDRLVGKQGKSVHCFCFKSPAFMIINNKIAKKMSVGGGRILLMKAHFLVYFSFFVFRSR